MTDTATRPSPAAAEVPRRRARHGVLLLVVVLAGVLLDVAVRTPLDGFAFLAAIVVLTMALVTLGGVRSTTCRALVAAATIPALFLCLRTSPWLVLPDLLAVGVLLALGTSTWPGDSLFDLAFGQIPRLAHSTSSAFVVAPGRIMGSIGAMRSPGERSPGRCAAIGRGLGLAVPVVAILALLLASADAVFASLLDLDVDLWAVPTHLFVVVAGMWVAAGFLTNASRRRAVPPRRPTLTLGSVEVVVLLTGLIVVYALFAAARLLVALRGDDYVVETTGLTYAEYARSGFFQLLWAVGLTLVVLLGVRAAVETAPPNARRRVAALSLVAVALTLVVVHTAIVRLGLYEEAFGLTMLRLYSSVFAWWIGAVLLLTAVAIAGLGGRRRWLPGAVLCSALATLLVVNVMDPEALVVERNAQRAAEGAEMDLTYALGLSDDAVPAVVAALPELEPSTRRAALRELCDRDAAEEPASWNLSSRAAARALAETCLSADAPG